MNFLDRHLRLKRANYLALTAPLWLLHRMDLLLGLVLALLLARWSYRMDADGIAHILAMVALGLAGVGVAALSIWAIRDSLKNLHRLYIQSKAII